MSSDHKNVEPLTSNDVSNSPSAWSHVYSRSNANSSRRTQCASVAYSTDGVSSSVRRSRYRRAKNKLQKQRSVLQEIVLSPDHVPFSLSDIEDEIIVFDGGNLSSPPITPPETVQWRRHHISDLHIQDDLNGDIGLTFRRIDGCLPFIRLPEILHLTSLEVVDLLKYTRHFKLAKIYGLLLVVATRNVYLLILARPPGMHVLDLRCQGIALTFIIIPRSWTNFLVTTGSLCCG